MASKVELNVKMAGKCRNEKVSMGKEQYLRNSYSPKPAKRILKLIIRETKSRGLFHNIH